MQMLEYSLEYDVNEQEVGLTKWTQTSKPVGCPWGNGQTASEKHDFDVSKCDKKSYLLVKERHILMPPNNGLPPPEELKNKKWCKWHNTPLHYINECRVFKQ
jgi:hypothetical protein